MPIRDQHSLHVEMCDIPGPVPDEKPGTARWKPVRRSWRWVRPNQRKMLHRPAPLTAQLCLAYGVPITIKWLTADQLQDGQRGLPATPRQQSMAPDHPLGPRLVAAPPLHAPDPALRPTDDGVQAMKSSSNNTIVWGIVAIVVVTLICATAVMLFSPDHDVAPIIGVLTPTIAALGALAQVQRMGVKVENVQENVEELSNGLMDSKIRAGVADVIPDHLLDDTYARHQLVAGRLRRERKHLDPGSTAGP